MYYIYIYIYICMLLIVTVITTVIVMIIVSAQVRPASLLDVLMHHARLLHRLRHMHDNLLTRGGTAPKNQGL